jgi:probable F420-dependent oxidoreductase
MINGYVCATDPSAAVAAATAAEAAGWESVWTGEHYVLPEPGVGRGPEADTPMLDPFIALANVAAHTRKLRLGSGLTVVPLHHPLMLAKQIVSLDRISGGRFIFGAGVGYLEPEFTALGAPMADRGDRTADYLAAMRAIWAGERSFSSKHVSFDHVRAEPAPLRVTGPPLHFGGHVQRVFERTVRQADGWYGWELSPERTQAALDGLRKAAAENERPAGLGEIEISVTPDTRVPLDDDLIGAYAELGVHRLIVVPPRKTHDNTDELVRFVERMGDRITGHPALTPA